MCNANATHLPALSDYLLFSAHNFVLSTQLVDRPYASCAASLFVPSQPFTFVASQTRLRKCKMLKIEPNKFRFALHCDGLHCNLIALAVRLPGLNQTAPLVE